MNSFQRHLKKKKEMARVITQDTFNEVVRENMEDFDMTEEEAVEEAKKQFEAQVCFEFSFFCFFLRTKITLFF